MQTDGARHYHFPRLTSVHLRAFSLFRLEPNAAVKFERGVMCLAGANGIGKSTFLAAVNFALTGAVPNPRRRLLSAAAYFKEAQDYSAQFFEGRIDEADRDVAGITISFEIGSVAYTITRGFFERDALRAFSRSCGGTVDAPQTTGPQLEAGYRSSMCADMGLQSFEQFVFLQHFLLTFDESRHLLFWDDVAATQTLYLAFGGSAEDAAQADYVNREMEKAGSWGRNLQFQVNNLTKRIRILEEALAQPGDAAAEYADAVAKLELLEEQLRTAQANSEVADVRVNEASLRVTQANAEVSSFRGSYEAIFDRFFKGHADPAAHPLVHTAIATKACPVCSTEGETVVHHITAQISAGQCPLCESTLGKAPKIDVNAQKDLSEVDVHLSDARRKLDEAAKTFSRVSREAKTATALLMKCRQDMADFETENQAAIDSIRAIASQRQGPVAQNLAALEAARAQTLEERDKAYQARDQHKVALRELQRVLEQRYAVAEKTFVPAFRKLAESFLGIDLDVSLATGQGIGMRLLLRMRGSSRDEHQLSESQRFFVDIALRMAIAQFMSDNSAPASIFIDTPEGSLDIAYEERAGEMFSRFVQSGHDLLMTANINSSKILTTLAKQCGAQRMQVVQMMKWTELSDVQQKANPLFQSAFTAITDALRAGDA